MDKVEQALKYLSERFGIKTKEEFLEAYEKMGKINIGVFVTVREEGNDHGKQRD
jgi:hypothetical protein